VPIQAYDSITVGGGIAASAFARPMAQRGASVLILEQETRFRDRVRGEGTVPWGVAEARELGLLELLRADCAHDVPFLEGGSGAARPPVDHTSRSADSWAPTFSAAASSVSCIS
jgi:menaquinone-9 beta-reductase